MSQFRRISMKVAAFASVIIFVSGCADKSSAPPTPPPPPPPPQLAIRSASETEGTLQAGAVPNSVWRIQIAEFRSSDVERLGLKQLFDQPLKTNAATAEAVTNSATFQLAQVETNVNLQIQTGSHIGIAPTGAVSNLVRMCMTTAGVDLLTCPSAIFYGTNEAQVSVQDQLTLITRVNARGQPAVARVAVGQRFDLRVLGMKDGAAILGVVGWFEQFQGYSTTNKGPMLELQVLAANVEVGPEEALLFGSKEERRITTMEDRIPYISDIPMLGRLFVKRQMETNYIRHVVIIRRVNP